MEYKRFVVPAFEREPGKWRANIRRADGTPVKVICGKKLEQSVTRFDACTAVAAARMAGTTIVDPYDHASFVADASARAERQCAMRRRHCQAIEAFAIRGAVTAKSIMPTVDARHFGMSVAAT